MEQYDDGGAWEEAQGAHDAGEAEAAEYERRTAWIPEAAAKGIPRDPGGCRAGYEMALFQNEGVFTALAAFVFDDRNGAWHPDYQPMIEAGRKALEKAGWKP